MNDDEQLQEDIANKVKTADSMDAKVYQKIFDALKKEPYELPFGFADRVVRRIEARQPAISTDHVWLGLGLLFIVIASLATAFLLKFSLNFGAFKFVSGYGGLAIFAAFLILAFQWIDKTIVQKRFRSSR